MAIRGRRIFPSIAAGPGAGTARQPAQPGGYARTRRRPPWLLVLLGAIAAPAIAADAGPHWSQLEFSAAKFLMSAQADITVQRRPAAAIADSLLATPEGRPVPAGREVLELLYRFRGFGLQSVATLWADPDSGASLQRTDIDGGSRQRLRSYRFTDIGAYHFSRWPATEAEKSLPPASWTERTQGLRPYPPQVTGRPVTEPTMLLWLAAAGHFSRPGDHGEVLTFSRKQVSRVLIDVTGRKTVRVDFEEQSGTGIRQRKGSIDAIALRLRPRPLDPGGDDADFELLGLRGDLELLIDPDTRTPLQVSGTVKLAGQLTVRLRRVVFP